MAWLLVQGITLVGSEGQALFHLAGFILVLVLV